MAITLSSYLKAPVPQPANQFDSSPPVLSRKRPPSELYYSSYGESEGTPTPKTRKARHPHSRAGFRSDPSSPIIHSPPSARVPRESSMEDAGEESDDVYDQFDLGDFTKEEIKRYEAMVGPGERLRDAASPREPSGPAPETTAYIYEDPLGTSITEKLPEELHDMLRAGLSNAIYRMADMQPLRGHDNDHEIEFEIDRVVRVFMEELAKPAPQMERFIRRNTLRECICETEGADGMYILRRGYGPRITVKLAHRIFEQEVYDFGRSLGLSKEQATGHVIKAREDSNKNNIDLSEIGNYESSECQDLLNFLDTYPEPEVLPSGEEPKDILYVSENEIEKAEQLLPGSNSYVAMKAADKTKEEKAARNEAKKARIAELQKARQQAEKVKSQKSNDHQAGRVEEQKLLTSNPEQPPNVQPLEDQDKPLKQKKKGRKRKREPELPFQSEEPPEHHYKHKKSRVDSEIQFDNPKTKRKEVRPQHSPFFQRSSGPNAKKKSSSNKAEQGGVSSSELKPPLADPPSILIKKRVPTTVISPPSNDSSPLSSLRSTPSLLSFDNEEAKSENKRILQLSHNCACSKPDSPTRKLRNDFIGLPTPASSPISLRDLNKRLLEGSIYQDGIFLAKPEAPTTLSVPKKPRKRSVTVSPFFAKSPTKKLKASDKISCIPFPPLQSTSFGLVQERLSHDPFRLLVAVIFLNKTRGSVALPVFYQLMERYPTPAELAAAKQEDVVEIIQHLGLQNQRAKKCINLAKAWLERPPEKGKRYRVLHYPKRDYGKDVGACEIIDEKDERVAWEIGQLPGIGVYAIDSWRIFCRDELRGLPAGLPNELTTEIKEEELQKEWTRVLAGDKELRAYLRWRWLRNGWEWDPVTGERRKADEGELTKAKKGGVIYEGEAGNMVVGEAKGEEADGVKAELEIGEEKDGKESGGVQNMIAELRTGKAPDPEGEMAENITAGPLHNDAAEKEQGDGKVTKDEPESSGPARFAPGQ